MVLFILCLVVTIINYFQTAFTLDNRFIKSVLMGEGKSLLVLTIKDVLELMSWCVCAQPTNLSHAYDNATLIAYLRVLQTVQRVFWLYSMCRTTYGSSFVPVVLIYLWKLERHFSVLARQFLSADYKSNGLVFDLSQSVSSFSDKLPSARFNMVITHDWSSATNSSPFNVRKSSITVKAVRLLPSKNG